MNAFMNYEAWAHTNPASFLQSIDILQGAITGLFKTQSFRQKQEYNISNQYQINLQFFILGSKTYPLGHLQYFIRCLLQRV